MGQVRYWQSREFRFIEKPDASDIGNPESFGGRTAVKASGVGPPSLSISDLSRFLQMMKDSRDPHNQRAGPNHVPV
jgi:hypothetical protein